MDDLNLCQKLVDKGLEKGADEIEVYYNYTKNIEVVWEKNDLQVPKTDDYRGVGIRVLKNDSFGFASSNLLTEKVLDTTVEKALQIARAGVADSYNFLPEKQSITEVSGLVDKEHKDFTLEEAIATGKKFVTTYLGQDRRVTLDSCNFKASISSRAISSSRGVKAREDKTVFSNMAMGFAREEDRVSSFDLSFQNSCHLSGLELENEARELAERVVNSLSAKSIANRKASIIISPFSALQMVIQPLVFAINAKNVIDNISPWQNKLGEKVAAGTINISDNALLEGEVGSRSFDREGIPPHQVKIIQNGKLISYLHNSYTARKMDVETTGHAGGDSRSQPEVSPTNFIVEAGNRQLNDIIGNTEEGLLVNRFSGNTNPISGDFSGVVKGGQFIKNGKIIHPVKEVMVAGNIYQLLSEISDLSRERKNISGYQIPYIKIDGVSITGQ